MTIVVVCWMACSNIPQFAMENGYDLPVERSDLLASWRTKPGRGHHMFYITLQHGPQNDFHELGLAILRALCWLGW